MTTELGVVTPKSGESLRVSCVLGPEPSEAGRIPPFLVHKGDAWLWHIEKALVETLDTLETRFYLGEIESEIAGNICTFEKAGVGILGHVFTRPAQRRRGVATALMDQVMEDFRRRGGKTLFLGTGFDSPAYHLYRSFGFQSVTPGSGDMRYGAEPDGFGAAIAGSEVAVRAAEWGDWARLNLLFLRPGAPYLRSLTYQWFGPCNVEGGYLRLRQDREKGHLHGAWVMETSDQIPVGLATVSPAPQWPQPIWQMDLHVRTDFEDQTPSLLRAISWPEGKIQAHSEASCAGLSRAFTGAGFREEGFLKGHLLQGDEKRDIILWGRA